VHYDRIEGPGFGTLKTVILTLAIALIFAGAFLFISSVTLVSCAGSLIVAGGCEGWTRSVVLTFWVVGTAFFIAAVVILIFGLKSSVKTSHNPQGLVKALSTS
jgi:hypothetical protein